MARKTNSQKILSEIVKKVYEARRDRQVNPDGSFDNKSRWYPSDAENLDNFTASIRSPSAAWPYSYMVAARTKKHCTALIEASLSGETVPSDVASVVKIFAESYRVAKLAECGPTADVRDLAQAVAAGADAKFALHDALIEAGCETIG